MIGTLPALLFLASALAAQTPPAAAEPAAAPVPVVKDPLDRNTPQQTVVRFLEACHARDYAKASHYLDLRRLPAADRVANTALYTHQLEELLDNIPFDIASLSRDSEGDQTDDLTENFDHLATYKIYGKILDLQLERVELRPGLNVWMVSAGSVFLIPLAHQLVAETPFEKRLPRLLVTYEIFDTPVWRWVALIVISVALWMLTGFLTWGVARVLSRIFDADTLRTPVRFCLTAAGIWASLGLAPPATLERLYIERALGLAFFVGVAALAGAIVDFAAIHWQAHLDPRVQSVSFSVLPLGRQIIKLSFFLIAVLAVFSGWGYNTSTILAGLGVGGLAVALAAQKTIENLFGGISVIGDRPVLVGDTCRFGDRTGVVMHIGLRSTRIRTAERTIISVPNAQFSSMPLENISGRDKILFHPILNLRRDTTSEQLAQVLAAFAQILEKHQKVETGKMPVRFIGVGPYSLDVEVSAYVMSPDGDEFLALQQELLLEMLKSVENAGTALAVPVQESVAR